MYHTEHFLEHTSRGQKKGEVFEARSHGILEFQNVLIFHSEKGGKNRKSYYHKENVLEASLKRPGKVGGS